MPMKMIAGMAIVLFANLRSMATFLSSQTIMRSGMKRSFIRMPLSGPMGSRINYPPSVNAIVSSIPMCRFFVRIMKRATLKKMVRAMVGLIAVIRPAAMQLSAIPIIIDIFL